MVRDYIVLPASGGWVAGKRAVIGATVSLDEARAAYEVDVGAVRRADDPAPEPPPLLRPSDVVVFGRGGATVEIRLSDLAAYLASADPDPAVPLTVLALPAGYTRLILPAGENVRLDLPVRRTGGVDVVGAGGSLTVTDGRLAGEGRFSIAGPYSSVDLARIRLDIRNGIVRDGIALTCQVDTLTVRDTRIEGVQGVQTTAHGDGIQARDGCRIDTLLIERVTICSGYQGVMTWRRPDGTGVRKLILRDVNIRDEPTLRGQGSIAYFLGDRSAENGGFGGDKTAPYEIVFDNVWADWPNPTKVLQLPVGVIPTGSINLGVPPGGDFCPA